VTAFHPCGKHEVIAQMRNMLEELDFMPQGDVVEQNQMLMDLTHVSHMRKQRKAEFPGQNADRKKFANASEPGAVCLDAVSYTHLDVYKRQDLGLTYCRSGDLKNGLAELLEAKKLSPQDPDIDQAIRFAQSAQK